MKNKRNLRTAKQSLKTTNQRTMKFVYYISMLVIIAFLSCSNNSDSPDDDASGSNNSIKYANKDYKLSKGLEEVFKIQQTKGDKHSGSQLNITDGEFYQTQVSISGNLNWIWRTRKANIWMYVKMYAPGFDGLTDGTYIYKSRSVDKRDSEVENNHFFKQGKVAIDLNNDGEIESDDNEYIDITGGTISVKVTGKIYIVDFNVKLENGESATGSFEGDFDQV